MFADNSPKRCKSNIRTQRIVEEIGNFMIRDLCCVIFSSKHERKKFGLCNKNTHWNSEKHKLCLRNKAVMTEGAENSSQCLVDARTFHNWKQTLSPSPNYLASSNFKVTLVGCHGEFSFHYFMAFLISPSALIWKHHRSMCDIILINQSFSSA